MRPSAVQGSIHAQLVRFNFSLDLASAVDHAERAIGLLDEQRDGATLSHVLVDRVFGGALRGEPVTEGLLERALALERRALAAGTGMPQPMVLLWLHCTDDAGRGPRALRDGGGVVPRARRGRVGRRPPLTRRRRGDPCRRLGVGRAACGGGVRRH